MRNNLSTEGVGEVCKNQFDVQKDEEEVNFLFDFSGSLNFTNESDDIEDVGETFENADEEVSEEIYDKLPKTINKYIKKISYSFYSLILILGLLGLVFLVIYYFLFKFARIIYIVIYNILLLFMLLSILLSAFYGILGYLLKAGSTAIQYILSTDNLVSDNPLVFKSKNKFVVNFIDLCANGDGDFTKIIRDVWSLVQLLENYKISYYEEKIDLLQKENNNCNSTETSILNDYYIQVINITDKFSNILNNITSTKCNFVKNDKNIFINEIKSCGNKALVISAFGFLIGIFLGLSILAGIALVHKYKVPNISKPTNTVSKALNESSQELS